MLRFLDLFSGTQSFRKALTEKYKIESWVLRNGVGEGGITNEYTYMPNTTEHIVEYIGIDIYSPEKENKIFDLLQEDIVKKLSNELNGGVPDFIGASPVCNKLSLATAMKGGHNPYFRLDKEKQEITPGPVGSMVDGAKNYQSIIGTEKAFAEANFTLKMFANTKLIVDHYNVPFVIENPRHSLTKYIMKGYEINLCSYCEYDFPQQKNTQIFSNRKFELKTCSHKRGSHSIGVYGKAGFKNKTLIKDYADRAAVPPKLIIDIITQSDIEEEKWIYISDMK